MIPFCTDDIGAHDVDRDLERERPMIERTINRLTRDRRIATRSEKLARRYLPMVTIARILEWV